MTVREIDRRTHHRATTAVRFWYRLPWSGRWQTARTCDLSQGGLSFVLQSGLCFKGLPIEVAVEVPSAAFRVRARVVATRTSADGARVVSVSFTRLSGSLGARLGQFVHRARSVSFASEMPLAVGL